METSGNNRMAVIDFRMPFWSMVVFMVKAAIASIPAIIILAVLGAAVSMAVASMLGGMGGVGSLFSGMH